MQTQDRSVSIGNYAFDEKNHLHTLDGKPLHGVTTILKVIGKGDVLVQWSANKAVEYIRENSERSDWGKEGDDDYIQGYFVKTETLEKAKTAWKDNRDKAGLSGTAVHSIIESYINRSIELGELSTEVDSLTGLGESAKVNKSVSQFVNWAIENKVKFIKAEQSLYSRTYWYGGIADIICEIDGKRFVGDIKTSSGIYPEHFIQTSAYAKALEEMGQDKFDGVVILNLKKTGGFDYRYNYDIEGNFECFKACLIIKKQLEAIK